MEETCTTDYNIVSANRPEMVRHKTRPHAGRARCREVSDWGFVSKKRIDSLLPRPRVIQIGYESSWYYELGKTMEDQ